MKKKYVWILTTIVLVLLLGISSDVIAPPSQEGLEHGRGGAHGQSDRVLRMFNGTLNESLSGLFNISINLENTSSLTQINLTDAVMNASFRINVRELERSSYLNQNTKAVFEFNPRNINFRNGKMSFVAKAPELWKCQNYVFGTNYCNDYNWTLVKSGMIVGQTYYFNFTNTDPLFIQTISTCEYTNATITIQSTFPFMCGGTGAVNKTRLLNNDGNTFDAKFGRNGVNQKLWTGIKITASNTSETLCKQVTSTQLCYERWINESWDENDQISVDVNGGLSWTNVSVSAIGTTANQGVACTSVSALESFSCNSFFVSTTTYAKEEITRRTTANGRSKIFWDVFYFNVSYTKWTLPSVTNIKLSTPLDTNLTTQNLTLNFNVSEIDNNKTYNITDWRLNGKSIALFHFPFDQSSTGANVRDFSHFGATFTKAGSIMLNKSGYTDGSGSYVFFGKTGDMLISAYNPIYNTSNTNFTILFRIKPNQVQQKAIISKVSTFATSDWMVFDQNGVLHFYIGENQSGVVLDALASTIPRGIWTNFAITRNGTTYSLYKNGKYVGKEVSSIIWKDSENLEIGSSSGQTNYYNGSLKDIMLINRSLSKNQILYYNNSGNNKLPFRIMSNETQVGDVWSACLTPYTLNDNNISGTTRCSNNLTIKYQNPSIFNVTLFNGTTRRVLNSSTTITSLINDTNLRLEIHGKNWTAFLPMTLRVNVTRYGVPTQTNLFYNTTSSGNFKINTTNLKNLTRYGSYAINVRLSDLYGVTTTTYNLTIKNQMIVNRTMQMLPNATPTNTSNINLTFNFTDDYAGSVDLNLTIRGRLGKIIQMNKTNFRLLGSQNASPNRLQSDIFSPRTSGLYNVSAQFTDGNGSKRMANYSFNVASFIDSSPQPSSSGAFPVLTAITDKAIEIIKETGELLIKKPTFKRIVFTLLSLIVMFFLTIRIKKLNVRVPIILLSGVLIYMFYYDIVHLGVLIIDLFRVNSIKIV